MIVTTKRCMHCGQEYDYQATGHGCLDATNNKEYCPECMQAILDALGKVEKKYEKRYKLLENPSSILLENLQKIKEDSEGPEEDNLFITPLVSSPTLCQLDYDVIHLYEYQRCSFAICWNDNEEDKKDVYVLAEYDLKEQKFTDKEWFNDKPYDYTSFRHGNNIMRLFMKKTKEWEHVKRHTWKEPCGEVIWTEVK